MEKPVFIHKGEKSTTEAHNNDVPLNQSVPIPNVIVKTADLDARQIKENLDKIKNADKTKKLEACNNFC